MSEPTASRYQRIRLIVSMLELGVSLAALWGWNASGAAFWGRQTVLNVTSLFWIQIGLYAVGLSSFLYLATFPLHVYRSHFLEKNFGLSHQRWRDWCVKEIKQSLLSLFLFLVVVEVGYACIRQVPRFWWLWFAAFWFIMSFGLTKIFPTVIVPLFYRYGRVEDPVLVEKLKNFLEKEGCRLEGIWTINFSKETAKANAAMMGFGKNRRVVLTDTLMKHFSPEEIQIVVAHEWGHRKCNHLAKSLFLHGGINLLGFFLLGQALGRLLISPPYLGLTDPAGLPLFLFAFTLYGLCLLPLENGISRLFEREADAYSLKVTQARQTFISAMQKLAQKNLAEVSPHPLVEFFFYDHPSIGRRITFAEKF